MSRNKPSHANQHRDATVAEKLFWVCPKFVSGKAGKRQCRRIKRAIHVITPDASVRPAIRAPVNGDAMPIASAGMLHSRRE